MTGERTVQYRVEIRYRRGAGDFPRFSDTAALTAAPGLDLPELAWAAVDQAAALIGKTRDQIEVVALELQLDAY